MKKPCKDPAAIQRDLARLDALVEAYPELTRPEAQAA